MKKLLGSFIGLIACTTLSTAFADTDPFYLTTPEQAAEYCPAANDLTFTATNPKIIHSKGIVTGRNTAAFTSTDATGNHYVLEPQHLSGSTIQDAQFSNTPGYYGFISDHNIHCYYKYTNFTGGSVNLILVSEQIMNPIAAK